MGKRVLITGLATFWGGLVAQALWSLARSALKTRALVTVCAAAIAAAALGVHELIVGAKRAIEQPVGMELLQPLAIQHI